MEEGVAEKVAAEKPLRYLAPVRSVKPEADRITRGKSLAFIGSASAQEVDEHPEADAEALSITRLEGSRWRGGRLWSWNQDPRA